jgi:glycosyltransferase involved in cell wall biosynthesis
MALGVPVISTACPSGPVEILGNGQFGLLVPPRDHEGMADAIAQLSKDESLHGHFVAKSLERADQLSIRNMARRYREEFLAELKARSR